MKYLCLPLILFLNFFLLSCASKLLIESEPSQAEILVRVEGKKDTVSLGQTPIEITETQLAEKLSLTPDAAQWINISLEKKDFTTREVLIPSNRWGESTKIIKLTLSKNLDKSTLVQQMLSYFFNAKKFSETRQFDQAHTEIDKILALDSKNIRALIMKGGLFYLDGKYDEAKRLYRESLTIDPSSSDAIKMMEKIKNKTGME